MRLLLVVQRYGSGISGGAESLCREFATRLAARDHDVHVLTSCAADYDNWANVLPVGSELQDGVVVHRLPTASPRAQRFFGPLNGRVPWGNGRAPLHLQRRWMVAQGPYIPALPDWLVAHVATFDVVSFFTYLYFTTWAGLPAAATKAPTVLHPTAHDEPPLHLPLFRPVFRQPRALVYLTEEEEALVARCFHPTQPSAVIGMGIDLVPPASPEAFRATYGLESRPYLLYLGRVEGGKGSEEMFEFFVAYKRRHDDDLALVLVGDQVRPLPPHPDVISTGFVDESLKRSALAGALALVQPSYFESFSIVLTEAWAAERPALVQGHCDVLDGQAHRSEGAIPYRGFGEFEAAVELLSADRGLCARLGQAGRRYVEGRYGWDRVLDDYEGMLQLAVAPTSALATQGSVIES